jgi:lipoprotein signal peptidase
MLKSLWGSIALLVLLDIGSRLLVNSNCNPGENISLIGDILAIVFVPNMSGFSWWVPTLPSWVNLLYQAVLLTLVVGAYPFYLFYTQTRRHNLWTDMALVSILSAGIGQLLEDLYHPYTTDFIQILHSPSANLADIYAFIGIGALVIEIGQIYRIHRTKGGEIWEFLSGVVVVREEFIQFIKNGFKNPKKQ